VSEEDTGCLDPRDEIRRLETRIEALAARLENCRKFVIAAHAAMAFGALVLAALILGVIRFDALAMVTGIAALLGGIVLSGSNKTTAAQTAAELAAAEARRAQLIGEIELQVIM
jgi:hypothetical protein